MILGVRAAGTGVRTRLLLAVLVAALIVPITAPAVDEVRAETFTTAAVDAAHPFSDPTWYPLRSSQLSFWDKKPAGVEYSARMGCANTNCIGVTKGGGHEYWALDFIGDELDPVHAAGAGIFHVGYDGDPNACGDDKKATWAWIDHGGGIVSRYHHLHSLVAKEGDLVTPQTMIARMGHSGDICRATPVNYLHFEVRRQGVSGIRYYPGPLKACVGGLVRFPHHLGFTNWDDMPYRNQASDLPRTGDSCIPDTQATANKTPRPKGRFGDHRAHLSWANPSVGDVNHVIVSMQIYRPSKRSYGKPIYTKLSASARKHTFRGLQNGRSHRFRVAYHNPVGYGAWSTKRDIVPAGPPTEPGCCRRLESTATKIRFAWSKSFPNGRPVTGYTVGIRNRRSGSWGPWRHTNLPVSQVSHNWEGRPRNRVHQVRVRGNSVAGSSDWVTRRISTK